MNYAESDEDELSLPENAFDDLVSPTRPVHTRAASPVLLAHPTLNDNVDEVLEEVTYKLHDIAQVEEEIEELTDILEDTDTKVDPLEQSKSTKPPFKCVTFTGKKEVGEVVEHVGEVIGHPQPALLQVPPDNSGGEESEEGSDTMVNYDIEDKDDGDKAQDLARGIKVEFDVSDIKFWFAQLEDEMEMASIGKQWLKKSVLQRNLPIKQKEDVKSYLSLQKAEAGEHIYLDIKNELIRIYAAKPQDSYRKALTRTMVGLPSQLGLQIVDDICKKPTKLAGCCCAGAALALWSDKLPVNIRAHVSQKEFTQATYKQVFEDADKVFLASKQVSVAAVKLDETLPAFSPHNQPEVAAISRRGGRGSARGGSARGGGRGRGNRGGGQRGGGSNATRRGPRHSSSPPESCCERHYVHGDQAWYCLAPHSCPWKDRCTPRP